jgi:peptidoglycan hydrolase-like protein with peptidoglycan-binding domain
VAVAWAVAVLALSGVAFLAGRWTFVPPPVEIVDRPQPTYTVVEATVGTAFDVTVQVTWREESVGTNAVDGTVTGIPTQGLSSVGVGDVLYSVDLRPVVVAPGAVPSFRDLGRGSTGPDVEQLQQFLVNRGYLTTTPDGKFGGATTVAVKAWQRAAGVEPTGVVVAGDLLFLDHLPALVVLDEALYLGAQLTSGQRVVTVIASEPTFTARVGLNQIPLLAGAAMDVSINGPNSVWQARSGAIEIGTDTATLTLTPATGDSICGPDCGSLTYSPNGVSLVGRIITAPEVTGPAVPLSALGTSASGEVFVLDVNGTRRTVQVQARDGSRAVVSGLAVGDVIRLFAVVEEASVSAGPSEP